MRLFRHALALVTTALLACGAVAQTVDASLNETIEMITLPGTSTSLETTIYKPDGVGPFPLVVINHARHSGEPKDQERFRPSIAARYFLQRGYAVIAPMRQGLSRSGGWYVGRGCDVERNAMQQAQDISGVLSALGSAPWADRSRVVVMGHSQGGMTALAVGASNLPGVRAVVNFAGGSRNSECPTWQYDIGQAVTQFGKQSRVPSLWVYGDNDSFFGDVYRTLHAQYRAAGGNAQLVPVSGYEGDAHHLFITRAGASHWQPQMTAFLKAVGLPEQPLEHYAKFGVETSNVPRASNFAALTDVDRVPHLRMFGRRAYRNFLDLAPPRAFAVGPDGSYGWANGEGAVERALDFCLKNTKRDCKLYAVDNDVVWRD